MVSLDLKDAYLLGPISPLHRQFLRFVEGLLRSPSNLPVESPSIQVGHGPQSLAQTLGPVVAHLHLRTVSIHPYIDNFSAEVSISKLIPFDVPEVLGAV